ncbi:MAG: T9SS type A sorting domain-containing protein [Lewinellaceae bacterium]|nr:T9SS type A sorting domain-containing protein [Saprospiraceae bacterium]MCB9311967.1 T9SS type A sorting domain-containing protein [Lewinellaceae bacterium]
MKVFPLILIIIHFILPIGKGQHVEPYHSIGKIHANNIQASIVGRNGLFSGPDGKFVYPGNGIDHFGFENFIHRNGVWLGGYNAGSAWRSSVSSKLWSKADFFPGPMNITIEEQKNWSRSWVVSGWEIWKHRNDFNDNGVIDEMPASGIMEWPGRGNPHFKALVGFDLVDQELAPFFDVDGDGIYDPLLGDFPCLSPGDPGSIPDQMVWFICNDGNGVPTESIDPGLGVDISSLIFAYNFSPEYRLGETVFVRQWISNRSDQPISDLHVGHFVRPSLGCFSDDLAGCQVNDNVMFAYNATGPDTVCNGAYVQGFPEPILTVSFLSHPMSSFLADHNPGPVDDFNDISDYQNLLQGYWYDGEPITFGGDGYQTGGPETKFMYPGRPSIPTSWTSLDQLFSSGIDFMLGVSNIGDLYPDQTIQVDHAYVLHELPLYGIAEAVDTALVHSQQIRDFYNNGFSFAGGNPIPCLSDCVWPGDMDANGICNNLDILQWGVSIDRVGVARNHPFGGWLPQYGLEWGPTGILTVDGRHQDANGDGQVDEQDIYVIQQSFGRKNGNFIDWGGQTITGSDMKWTRLYNGFTSPNEHLMSGQSFMLRLDVSGWPIDSIYSLGYSVSWDTTVVSLEPGFDQTPKSSPLVDSSEIFYRLEEEGMLHVGITRTNHLNQPFVPFELGKLLFRIKSNAVQDQFPDTTFVRITNVKSYLANGTEMIIGSEPLAIPFGIVTSLEGQNSPQSAMSIHPNPSDGLVTWTSGRPLKELRLYTVDGNLVQHWALPGTQNIGQLNLQLPGGVYFLLGQAMDGTIHRVRMILW